METKLPMAFLISTSFASRAKPLILCPRAVFVSLILLCTMLLFPQSSFAKSDVRDAIVKIYTVRNNPNYYNPWLMHGPSSSTGSGCILQGNMIITNGHVVSNETFVQVRRYGNAKKYRAKVLNVSHEADLALLSVEDDGFFKGAKFLRIGDLPKTQQEVLVYGFPRGGDTLSITKGVISRIEHQLYVHSSRNLLAGQIDAAINPGNSGGPVIVDDKVVGVVMQVMAKAENIGYMVPAPVIKHFLKDIEDGRLDGFPSMGVLMQDMENSDLKLKYGVDKNETGALVIKVLKGSPSHGKLLKGDVILEVDGHNVGDDGTVEFRPRERTSLSYYIQKHQIGEVLTLKVLRDGEPLNVSLVLSRAADKDLLIPEDQYDVLPTYFIYGGLVFSSLTKNYIKSWGRNWWNMAPKEFTVLLNSNIPEMENQEVVIIVKVLAADVNEGYHDISNRIITEVDGKKINNLAELVDLAERENGNEFIEFKGPHGNVIILNRDKVVGNRDSILKNYKIMSDRSEDLKN